MNVANRGTGLMCTLVMCACSHSGSDALDAAPPAPRSLYVLGGYASGTFQDVEVATIAPDDTPSAFVSAGVGLGRDSHAQVVIGGNVFLIGGDGPYTLGSVAVAPMLADGRLGPFANAQTQLITARFGATAAVVGASVYVLGGNDGSKAIASVERATLKSDGTLGPFSNAGMLTSPRLGASATVVGGYLYVAGGYGNGAIGVGQSLERAAISSDDSLGPFQAVTGMLAAPREFQTSAIIGSFLYEVGGIGSVTSDATLERAPVNSDGTLGAFEMAGSLVAPRYEHSMTIVGDYVYVIGGTTDSMSGLTSTERAHVGSDGTLGPFTTVDGMALKTGRFGHTSL